MKLFFDQNISYRIVTQVSHIFPNSKSARQLSLEDTPDISIRDYCKKHDYTIVTFDSDFSELATVFGHPPKIIWLRTGNLSTLNILNILITKADIIKDFIQNPTNDTVSCIEIL